MAEIYLLITSPETEPALEWISLEVKLQDGGWSILSSSHLQGSLRVKRVFGWDEGGGAGGEGGTSSRLLPSDWIALLQACCTSFLVIAFSALPRVSLLHRHFVVFYRPGGHLRNDGMSHDIWPENAVLQVVPVRPISVRN
jgi:hypothetical protein